MKIAVGIGAGGSGSMGTVTWSRNKGGYYVRNRSTPTNPNSSRQQTTRTLFGNFASEWTTVLTQVQRDTWNTYAQTHTIKDAIGRDIYINGLCWFVMFNTRLADAARPSTQWPPSAAAPSGLTTFTPDISAITTVDVVFAPVLPAGHLLQLWMTLPGTAGQTPNFKQARLVAYSPIDQVTPWAATMPFNVISSEQCTFYCAIMNGVGQISVMEQDTDLADY